MLKTNSYESNIKSKNNNKILFETPELSYEILTPSDKVESKAIIALAFLDEPLTKTISKQIRPVEITDFEVFINFFLEEVCNNGLSVLARSKETGKLVGVCYNMDYNFLDEKFFNFFADNKQVLHNLVYFLNFISNKVKKINQDLDLKGSVIDIWMLAVHPEFRGKKISNRLVEFSVKLIENSGFGYAVCEATSSFTRSIMQSIGFECLYKQDVRNWFSEGRCFYESMEEPHNEFTFWLKKFNRS